MDTERMGGTAEGWTPTRHPGRFATAYEALTSRLGGARGPVTLSGVAPGARGVAVAAVVETLGAAVVVVATARDAEELVAGMRVVAPHLAAAAIPAEAMSAYLGRSPSLGATAEAAAALLDPDLDALVVPARLLPFPFPDPGTLRPLAPRLAPGDAVDLADLAHLATGLGYRRVKVVEEAGEIAVRGEICDIATPDVFVRIVVDVDEIESIRVLDPATQRSGDDLPELVVPPLCLFPDGAEAREALARRLDAEGCDRAAAAVRDDVLREWWEGLLGWTLPHLQAWDLLPGLVVCERDAVLGEVERALAALRHARDAAEREMPLPPPETWLGAGPECEEAVRGAHRVEHLLLEASGATTVMQTAPTPALAARPRLLVDEIRRGIGEGLLQAIVTASAGEAQRLENLFGQEELAVRHGWPEPGVVGLVRGDMPRGFVWRDGRIALFGRNDVTSLPPPARRRRSLAVVLAELRDLRPGDFVVHVDHGIGRFAGFTTLTLDGNDRDCVELEYGGGGKLLVPLERADVLEKYTGSEGPPPRLDRLGGTGWSRTKARVKKALRDLADDLLKVQARRELAPGFAYSKDSPWQRDFENAFEYDLTPDQDQAVRDVKRDMESPRPMDRLLVGDVGYGKTEVAMRAAFKAVLEGKQVALLAPTTILAEQHYRTFTRRFRGFPVEVRWLSRFLPAPRQREVVAGLAAGTVDVVIGTHRLLAADVTFRDLGLVVVDEEQRFGVAQKEKLKKLKSAVDVLALSATPIPRTLNLGLLGLRDVSVIETPPRDRLAVQTHVLPFRPEVVREAVAAEMARGGQTYFVHNRVASIGAMASFLRETVPDARVVVAHGQMDERELERAMEAFFAGAADVLLATSIIENGLDIPNANTLIVNRADRFGLAQLYQLRGRVGRSDRLAFSYFLVPPEVSLSDDARQRLAAIVEFAELGAGFRIAARDLEIRGAGNLLGAEQHGHLRAVGYETYCHLLEEVVRELRGEEAPPAPGAAELRLGLDLRLPDSYIADETLRLAVYRRIAAAREDDDLDALREEFVDRFGGAPRTLENLILHQRVRRRAEALGINRIRRTGLTFEIALDAGHPAAHEVAMAVVAAVPEATVTPAGVVRLPSPGGRDAFAAASALLDILPLPGGDGEPLH